MEWLLKILKDAGIEKAEDIVKSITTELPKHFKPAEEFNNRGEEIKTLKGQIAQRDKDIEDLKKTAGKDSDLATKLQTLETTYATEKENHEKLVKDLQITNAIKLAIASEAQDAELVSGLIDKTKLILNDDGKVTGLDDQIKTIKEGKPFLFKSTENQNQQQQSQPNYGGFNPYGGGSPDGQKDAFGFGFAGVRAMPDANKK